MANPIGLFRTSLLYFLSGSYHSYSGACTRERGRMGDEEQQEMWHLMPRAGFVALTFWECGLDDFGDVLKNALALDIRALLESLLLNQVNASSIDLSSFSLSGMHLYLGLFSPGSEAFVGFTLVLSCFPDILR